MTNSTSAPDWEAIISAGPSAPSDVEGVRRLIHAAEWAAREEQDAFDQIRALTDELLELRHRAAGRPVVNHRAFAELQELCAPWKTLAAMHRLNGEARGVAVLDTMIRVGLEPVKAALGGRVLHIHREYQCGGRGRVDRAVEHEGGRLSLIEAKDGATPRDIVAGIGQVLFYKAAVERSTSFRQVDPMLAVLHDFDPDIARACSLAGVTYLPLGDIAWTRALSRFVNLTVFEGQPR